MTPPSPDICLAANVIGSRLGAYKAWRERTTFAIPAVSLGGDWAAAHHGLVQLQCRLRALDAECRQAELANTVDGGLSDAIVSRLVDKHLPDWESLYARIKRKVRALDVRAHEMVAEGVFVWGPLVR